MQTSTHNYAGSIPDDFISLGYHPFDDKFLAESDLNNFQRKISERLLCIAETLPTKSCVIRAISKRSTGPGISTLLVNFVPRNNACAEMIIYINRDSTVDIGAGRESTFGLPHNVWDKRASDLPEFTEKIVRSVTIGNLRETMHLRGNLIVRCESELCVDGIPVLVDRTDMGSVFRVIFRKRSSQEIVYLPYS